MHCHLIALVLIASTAVLVEIKCQTTNISTTLLETSSTLGTSDGKLGGSCTWQQQFSLQAFILIVPQCCFCFFAFFPPCNIQKYIAALRDHSEPSAGNVKGGQDHRLSLQYKYEANRSQRSCLRDERTLE
jgi:hypothetical protein